MSPKTVLIFLETVFWKCPQKLSLPFYVKYDIIYVLHLKGRISMSSIKRFLKHFVAPNIQYQFLRRKFFSRKYQELFEDTEWIYSKFCKLCSTYLVDEDNIADFNKKKKVVVLYTRHLAKKLIELEEDVNCKCDLNRKARKCRESIVKKTNEIISMCA